MSTLLSWMSPSCIEESSVPFPSFGHREKEHDFTQLAVLDKREARRTCASVRRLSRRGRCRGMISLSKQTARRTGPGGFARSVAAPLEAETPPAKPTGERRAAGR
jgi:hypothetical protein